MSRRRPIKYELKPEQKRSDYRTICEVHRELHRYVTRLVRQGKMRPGDAKYLHSRIEETYDLGKRMMVRMVELHGDAAKLRDELFEKGDGQ